MTAQLIFTTFNGRESYAIEYFPAPKIEPSLGTVTRRVTLTDAESGLSLDQVKALHDAGALAAQKPRAA